MHALFELLLSSFFSLALIWLFLLLENKYIFQTLTQIILINVDLTRCIYDFAIDRSLINIAMIDKYCTMW